MGCHTEYCRLCGCAVGERCVQLGKDAKTNIGVDGKITIEYGKSVELEDKWMTEIVCLTDPKNKPGEARYGYDGYGRIENLDTGEKMFCRACHKDEHVVVHRACWEICDKPLAKDIRVIISVPEFRLTDAQDQVFAVDQFLQRFPKHKFFLDDPRTNRENYNRVRFAFYRQKFEKK